MRKSFKCLLIAALAVSLMPSAAYAKGTGWWKKDETGWRWQRDDGSFASGEWSWIDGDNNGTGECYHFSAAGYLDTDTEVDGYTVDTDGAWTENGEKVLIFETFDEIGGNVSVDDDSREMQAEDSSYIPPALHGLYRAENDRTEYIVTIYQAMDGEEYLYYKSREKEGTGREDYIFTLRNLGQGRYAGMEHTSFPGLNVSFTWSPEEDSVKDVVIRNVLIGEMAP